MVSLYGDGVANVDPRSGVEPDSGRLHPRRDPVATRLGFLFDLMKGAFTVDGKEVILQSGRSGSSTCNLRPRIDSPGTKPGYT